MRRCGIFVGITDAQVRLQAGLWSASQCGRKSYRSIQESIAFSSLGGRRPRTPLCGQGGIEDSTRGRRQVGAPAMIDTSRALKLPGQNNAATWGGRFRVRGSDASAQEPYGGTVSAAATSATQSQLRRTPSRPRTVPVRRLVSRRSLTGGRHGGYRQRAVTTTKQRGIVGIAQLHRVRQRYLNLYVR